MRRKRADKSKIKYPGGTDNNYLYIQERKSELRPKVNNHLAKF